MNLLCYSRINKKYTLCEEGVVNKILEEGDVVEVRSKGKWNLYMLVLNSGIWDLESMARGGRGLSAFDGCEARYVSHEERKKKTLEEIYEDIKVMAKSTT